MCRLTNSEIVQVSLDFSEKCSAWLPAHGVYQHKMKLSPFIVIFSDILLQPSSITQFGTYQYFRRSSEVNPTHVEENKQ